MTARLSMIFFAILLLAATGCSLFHKESPQQQYTEAIMRGNSMQASQIWLNMSPEDRMKFSRGEGIAPDQESTRKDVQQLLNEHYANQGGVGPSNAEEMEQQSMPTPLGASLRDLPAASESSSPSN